MFDFSVNYNIIDINSIINIYKYLMKKHDIKKCLDLLEKCLLSFSESLTSMTTVSNFTTYISLNKQPCMTRPNLIDLNLDEYNQGLRYYPFIVNLDR